MRSSPRGIWTYAWRRARSADPSLYFFPKRAAFNIAWREAPERRIDSYIEPRGCLTKAGAANQEGDHSAWYEGFPPLQTTWGPPV